MHWEGGQKSRLQATEREAPWTMAAHWMSWVAIDVCHSLPREAQGEREGEAGGVKHS